MNKKKYTKTKNQETPWEERVIQVKRVTKVVKGGKKLSFRAILVIGNENGQVGVGIGKASDVIGAVKKAVTDAKKNIITIPLTRNSSIPHIINGIFGAATVIIKPSAQGSGVIAGGSVRTVIELAGIKNILAKQLGSSNTLNNARATINALSKLKTFKNIAQDRNILIY
jgi:small subunit ribosomal protein S5|uniref:Small ribosomal subunit protein uS5c n=1 Tax=Thorea hispida TaxID=202687 RepID=A0A1C9CAS7_9FLOR|nr:ribosomal protein S5 [Thorea hispida]AOM65469.1 ribosomal protein S5 [Thorea hispida]ARX95838.1 30S ribosomal protein S5 [Thorea hispida]UNJ79123.1 ribosomal protein S5 [Thorea hispida]